MAILAVPGGSLASGEKSGCPADVVIQVYSDSACTQVMTQVPYQEGENTYYLPLAEMVPKDLSSSCEKRKHDMMTVIAGQRIAAQFTTTVNSMMPPGHPCLESKDIGSRECQGFTTGYLDQQFPKWKTSFGSEKRPDAIADRLTKWLKKADYDDVIAYSPFYAELFKKSGLDQFDRVECSQSFMRVGLLDNCGGALDESNSMTFPFDGTCVPIPFPPGLFVKVSTTGEGGGFGAGEEVAATWGDGQGFAPKVGSDPAGSVDGSGGNSQTNSNAGSNGASDESDEDAENGKTLTVTIGATLIAFMQFIVA